MPSAPGLPSSSLFLFLKKFKYVHNELLYSALARGEEKQSRGPLQGLGRNDCQDLADKAQSAFENSKADGFQFMEMASRGSGF